MRCCGLGEPASSQVALPEGYIPVDPAEYDQRVNDSVAIGPTLFRMASPALSLFPGALLGALWGKAWSNAPVKGALFGSLAWAIVLSMYEARPMGNW